jgi:hypothetical protein
MAGTPFGTILLAIGMVLAAVPTGWLVGQEPVRAVVASVDEHPGRRDIHIDIVNDSPKSIYGWQVDVYIDHQLAYTYWEDGYVAEFVPGTRYLRPGETTRIRYGTRRVGPIELRIAAIFHDRTAIGPDDGVSALFKNRAAERDYLALWVERLRSALDGAAVDAATLRSQIQQSSAEPHPAGLASLAKSMTETLTSELDAIVSPAQRAARLRALLRSWERRHEAAVRHTQRAQEH